MAATKRTKKVTLVVETPHGTFKRTTDNTYQFVGYFEWTGTDYQGGAKTYTYVKWSRTREGASRQAQMGTARAVYAVPQPEEVAPIAPMAPVAAPVAPELTTETQARAETAQDLWDAASADAVADAQATLTDLARTELAQRGALPMAGGSVDSPAQPLTATERRAIADAILEQVKAVIVADMTAWPDGLKLWGSTGSWHHDVPHARLTISDGNSAWKQAHNKLTALASYLQRQGIQARPVLRTYPRTRKGTVEALAVHAEDLPDQEALRVQRAWLSSKGELLKLTEDLEALVRKDAYDQARELLGAVQQQLDLAANLYAKAKGS